MNSSSMNLEKIAAFLEWDTTVNLLKKIGKDIAGEIELVDYKIDKIISEFLDSPQKLPEQDWILEIYKEESKIEIIRDILESLKYVYDEIHKFYSLSNWKCVRDLLHEMPTYKYLELRTRVKFLFITNYDNRDKLASIISKGDSLNKELEEISRQYKEAIITKEELEEIIEKNYLSKFEARIKKFEDDTERNITKIEDYKISSEQLDNIINEKIEFLKDNIETIKSKVNDYDNELNKLNDNDIKRLNTSLESLTKEINDIKARTPQYEATMKKVDGMIDFDNKIKEIESVKESINTINGEIEELGKKLEDDIIKEQIKNLNGKVEDIDSNIKECNKKDKDLEDIKKQLEEIKGFKDKISECENIINNLDDRLKGLDGFHQDEIKEIKINIENINKRIDEDIVNDQIKILQDEVKSIQTDIQEYEKKCKDLDLEPLRNRLLEEINTEISKHKDIKKNIEDIKKVKNKIEVLDSINKEIIELRNKVNNLSSDSQGIQDKVFHNETIEIDNKVREIIKQYKSKGWEDPDSLLKFIVIAFKNEEKATSDAAVVIAKKELNITQ